MQRDRRISGKRYRGNSSRSCDWTRGDGRLSASLNSRCRRISDLAVRSLLYEVSATPKPGLVDRNNSGAHRDMDYQMFLDSAASLRECFQQCALAGVDMRLTVGQPGKPSQTGELESTKLATLALSLRRIGLEGEAAMFQATGGVNTHKGLVFSLGIISAACGWLSNGRLPVDAGRLQALCGRMAGVLLEGNTCTSPEPSQVHLETKPGRRPTHGEMVYQETGLSGVRGEALSGFSTAFALGLPRLREGLSQGYSVNSAMVRTLMYLMAETEDSNLVYRGGLEGLQFARDRAEEILNSGNLLRSPEDLEVVRRLDQQFIRRNLSPGGCADLLAISVMLHFVTQRENA